MKKIKNTFGKILITFVIVSLMACSNEEKLTESQLDISTPQLSDLDRWIKTNFVDLYNIRVQYKWDQNLADPDRFLTPPTESKVQPALEVIKKLWIDSYSTVGGPDFVKKLAPRELVLIAGFNLNADGTVTQGTAEGGMRIAMFEVDLLRRNNVAEVRRFIHVLQHEYIHILNQTKPFDEAAFGAITPSGYTSNWYAISDAAAREKGFITNYAQDKAFEDFAEMASTMLDYSKSGYDALVNGITSVPAKAALRAKEALVVKYYKDTFNIDFYALQAEVEKNRQYILSL